MNIFQNNTICLNCGGGQQRRNAGEKKAGSVWEAGKQKAGSGFPRWQEVAEIRQKLHTNASYFAIQKGQNGESQWGQVLGLKGSGSRTLILLSTFLTSPLVFIPLLSVVIQNPPRVTISLLFCFSQMYFITSLP